MAGFTVNHAIFILAAICLLAGCTPRTARGPVVDTADTDTAINATALSPAAFSPTPSIIYIPVEVKTAYIERALNDELSGALYDDTATIAGISNARVTIKKNGRIKVTAQNGEFVYTMPLKISVKISTTIGALGITHTEHNTAEAGVSLKMRSKISLNRDWSLTTSTKTEGYKWTSDPVLKIRSMAIPLKPAADALMARYLETAGRQLDNTISNSPIVRDLVAPLWAEMQTPMRFSAPEIRQAVYLRITPAEAYAGALRVSGGSIKTTVGVSAVTEAFMGVEPDAPAKPAPLPNFKPLPGKIDSSFAVTLYSEIPYAEATRLAKEQFIGKSFKSGRQKVTINDIEITGGGNGTAAVTMDVSGSIKGTVRVVGRAAYDAKAQAVTLENLDFDVVTSTKFEKAKNWLLKGVIISKMKPHMKFPVGELLDEAKVLAEKALGDYKLGGTAVLHGTVEEIAVAGVELTETGLRAAVTARGALGVGIK